MKYKSELLEAIHETMTNAYQVGAIDNATMEHFNQSCLVQPDTLNNISILEMAISNIKKNNINEQLLKSFSRLNHQSAVLKHKHYVIYYNHKASVNIKISHTPDCSVQVIDLVRTIKDKENNIVKLEDNVKQNRDVFPKLPFTIKTKKLKELLFNSFQIA